MSLGYSVEMIQTCASVPTSPRPAHLALAHRRPRHRRALEQLVPVLLTHQTAGQQVVAVPLHQLRSALAARETLEVEDVRRRSRPHHELAGRDRVAARRTRSAVPE